MGKIIAAYGGGFKPPTKGHFQVVKDALDKFPEIDEFIIYVGSGTRDGISQLESILVWEVYNNYLPMKVKIEPSKSPIGDIIRLGKNNPQDTVYFIIGSREGNEEDQKDYESRTKNIEGKYPNMKVKLITTPQGEISGTKARKSLLDSPEEFYKFTPEELNDKERGEVFDTLRQSITETSNLEDGKSAPFGSGYIKVNENASYSDNIDYKKHIVELTKHMLDSGMNIKPLPKVIFVNGDSANARQFLGKTAYYDPNNSSIVLYTEGRHPKDIVRSFSHEMIHHIQNLEGRLGNITTTNTQEDDNLNDIEAEANLKGTMTFRNWTDSLNEAIVGDKIECDNCDWSWNIVDGGDDLFMCHKCGHDNTPLNENILPQEKFAQETGQDWVERALRILPKKEKYNLKDYTVEILPLDKVKPTQFGEDYINASSEYEAEQYQKYIDGKIKAEDLRKEDFYPIVVDKDTMEILDGNHRHAVHTMLDIPKIKAILISKKSTPTEGLLGEEDQLMVEVVNPDGGRFEYEESNKPYKHKYGFNDKLGKDPFGLNQYARELAQDLEEAILNEGRYDKITNQVSKEVFAKFKEIYDSGAKEGNFTFSVGPDDEEIFSEDLEFNLEGYIEVSDEMYQPDGGANAGYDDDGEEIPPLIQVSFKIPQDPKEFKWSEVSFDIKDIIRHEIEHLTQDGENVKSGKYLEDDQLIRKLIKAKMLPKSQYFKLEKEVDAMLQGLYFRAKKSRTPFKEVILNYFKKVGLTKEEQKQILNIWRNRRKALALPTFENNSN